MIRQFLKDDGGAVTTDFVVLTAGVVGLGMATTAVVSGGLEGVANDTTGTMEAVTIRTAFETATTLATGLAQGLGDWVGGTLVDVAGFGEILQIGPNQTAGVTMSIPPGSTSATLSFDLLGVDDLSGESAVIYVNGNAVAVYADDHGRITTSTSEIPGITVSMTQQYTNDPMGGGSHGSDSRATYQITVDNPQETLSLSVMSTSGQPVTEEYFAIDDFNVVAN